MTAYSEPEKKKVRAEALKFAIDSVSKNRFKSTVARNTYVREVRDHIQNNGSDYDKAFVAKLREEEIDHWESFYSSSIGKKKPQDLKIAYLSGPNPINDLEELVKYGILPENVWAFESDKNAYDQAIIAALESQFPFIKIYKGKIEKYFQILQVKFDIVYLDFCGVITSSQTLSVVRDLFQFQKLNSPGVLITNFAFPEEENSTPEFWNNLVTLTAHYLYPKSFTESFTKYGGGFIEGPEFQSISFDQFLKKAFKNPHTFYSQFITRVLFDLPSLLIPYQRFCSNPTLVNTFFKQFDTSKLPVDHIDDIIHFPSDHSLTWGLNDFHYKENNFGDFLRNFSKQLAFNGDEKKLLESIDLMTFFTGEGIAPGYYSDKLEKISKKWSFLNHYIFCDVFLFHQLKDILIGQMTNPYQYNISKTQRWTYKAKQTRMFMDLIVYDECRYIYDWMPTIDMFEEGVNNLDRQLTLRFALDSIAKQRRWYNDEFLSGTAVIDQDTPKFQVQELKRRKVIN